MKVTRIRLANYRGIDALEVRLPRQGVCVLAGDNEAGKSSLVEAIDLLLEFPHDSRNQAVLATKPVHRDTGAEIEVDIEAGPFFFTYRKRYHVAPRTELIVHAPQPQNQTGREAHERVRAILREFVDLELWRALRVPQGAAGEQAKLVATPSLARALAESAQRESQQQEDLFAAVRREYELYFTPTGETRRALLDEEADVARRRDEVAKLAQEAAAVEADAERVVELEQTLHERQAQRAVATATGGKLAREREAAQAHAQALLLAQQEVVAAEAALRRCENTVRLLRQHDKLTQEHTRALAAANRAAEREAGANASLAAAAAQHDGACAERAAAQRAAVRRGMAEKVATCTRTLADWQALQRDLASVPKITAAALDLLARSSQAHTEARARLLAQAAELRLRAQADVQVRVTAGEDEGEDVVLRAGDERRFVVPTRLAIDLAGVEIELRAGSQAGDLAATLAQTEAALGRALREVDAADIESARARYGEQRERQRAADEIANVLARLLDERDPARWPAALERLAAEVAAAGDPGPGPDLAAAAARATAAEAAWQAAQRAHLDAQAESQRAAIAAATLLGSLRANAAARAELAGDGAPCPTLADAERELAPAAARLQGAREAAAALPRAGTRAVAEVDADLARARAAEAEATAEVDATRDSLVTLRARLAVRGEEGLADRLGRAEADLTQAVQTHDGKRRRAAAAATLHAALRNARATCVQTYHGPIRAGIERLGRAVFGSSFQVALDDRLQVTHRTLDGVTVAFRDLSLGAREQIAILQRLACALAVAPHGGVPVWLDDALGQTDPERLRGMGRALRAAGERCQVVVLTCSPARAQWPGVHTVRVQSRGAAPNKEAAG